VNTRERFLAVTLLGVVIVGVGGFTANALLLEPIWQRSRDKDALLKEIQTKTDRVNQILAQRARLERYRALSLPADVDTAHREYEVYLRELLRKSGIPTGAAMVTLPNSKQADSHGVPTLANKEPIYTRLEYTLQLHSGLDGLVKFLQSFYRTPLLHRIKTLSVRRPNTTTTPGQAAELETTLTIEALVVNGAGNRVTILPGIDPRLLAIDTVTALRHGTPGLGLALWGAGPTGPVGPRTLAQPPRDYLAILNKDVFMGPAPLSFSTTKEAEPVRYVYLTDITHDEKRSEAWLYNRLTNHKDRLRAERGFDFFPILNAEGETLTRGRVLRLDEKDVLLLVDGKYYNLHIGQNLGDALARPVASKEEVDRSCAALAHLSGW
jgi:hypothetical protein